MKDIVFDLFTPKIYGQVRSLTYSPRSAVTLKQWQEAVLEYKKTFADFMSLSNFVKSNDEHLRDQYFTALLMNDRAMEMLDKMEETLFILREEHRTTENLYNKMQKDDSLSPFFKEFQETSYYFTNSFESFMNYFIKSLRAEGERLRARIIILYFILSGIIICITLVLTIYLARDLGKKLYRVEQCFRLVSLGNFSVKMEIDSRDEFGELSETFNSLVTDLKENVESILNLTRDIGSFITEGSELKDLLRLVAQVVIQDTSADSVLILKVNRDGQAAQEVMNGIDLDPGDEDILLSFFSSRIIRSNSSIIFRNDGRNPEEIPGFSGFCKISSMLAVPLVVEGRVFGIIVAVKSSVGEYFSDLGVTRLTSFAEYTSLSIDNFLKYTELIERREARYQALSSQVQPHFIYNVMSGILGLNAKGDSEGLRDTVEALKGMLRYIQSGNNWTSIEEEFGFLRKYLMLQKIRFGNRLDFRVELDEEISHLQIPRLLLQPLAENAVMHGIEPLESGGLVEVKAVYVRRRGEIGADIVITDNGKGFDTANIEDKSNIGLLNVKQRIQIAFPDSSFQLESSIGDGTRIEINI